MISFSHINKQYGRQVLFVDASFQLNPGDKVGLVGPNGAGKTTLFRMIVGEETPDDGDVSVAKKLTIGYFRQDVEEMSAVRSSMRPSPGADAWENRHHELNSLQHAMADPARADDIQAFSPASARFRKNTITWAATRWRARPERFSTASVSKTIASTATLAFSPVAGKCAWRWRACCSAVPMCVNG